MPYNFVPTTPGRLSDLSSRRQRPVFAYDIAWEPEFRATRTRQDGPSLAGLGNAPIWQPLAAQTAWGVAPPVDASGKLTGPSDDEMLALNGPNLALVIDYRKFLDDGRQEPIAGREDAPRDRSKTTPSASG